MRIRIESPCYTGRCPVEITVRGWNEWFIRYWQCSLESQDGISKLYTRHSPCVIGVLQRTPAVKHEVLEHLRRAGKYDIVMQALKDTSPLVRAEAARILGGARYQPAVPQLLELLKDRFARPAYEAVRALTKIGDASVLPSLRTALKREMRSEVVTALLWAVSEFEDKEAVPILVQIAKHDKDDFNRDLARSILFNWGIKLEE